MNRSHFVERTDQATALLPLTRRALRDWVGAQAPAVAAWVETSGFVAAPHTLLRIPDPPMVLLGLGDAPDLWSYASAPRILPAGEYRIAAELDAETATRAALAWALGCYRFETYKSSRTPTPRLCWPANADRARVRREERAILLVRNLVNTPANDLGPAELAAAAQDVAGEHHATVRVLVGDELLEEGYLSLIHI